MDVLTLDGSYGEGGGQILRTALSLAALTVRPFRLTSIRAGRRDDQWSDCFWRSAWLD